MHALRESACVADVRLERKLHYDFAKLKARGRLQGVLRSRYASAASAAASSRQYFVTNSHALTTTSEKRGTRQNELGRGAQKRQRRSEILAGDESHTPMSQTQGTHATSPDIGSDHDDDVVEVPAPHKPTGNALGEARSRLATLEGDRARLLMMESRQTRVEAQLDLLIRMQHPVATPIYAAQAPSSLHGTGLGLA
uniref:Uncharacterized protein n=1 Tax=Peronospora matthiolae TaxID=2874970 RepID=A0AAV1V676_9STRA